MKNLEIFYRASSDPNDNARQWKEKNRGKTVGYLCSYVPEELIMAAGALPFRILGTGSATDSSLAYSYLPSYSCAIVRNVLEDALSGELDFLDGVIFPHTCDAIMRLSDIWRLNVKFGFHSDLLIPSKTQSESAREYMASVIGSFRKELEKRLETTINDKAISAAIKLCNRIREKVGRLYEISEAAPETLGIGDIHAVTSAAMVMDREELDQELEQLLKDLGGEPKTSEASNAKRIILTGNACRMTDIYRKSEETEMNIVWDDLCSGASYFQTLVAENGDPIKAIAERYLNRIVCPSKYSGDRARGEHLLDKAKEKKAEGVIFLHQKFCDPYSFDYPYIRDMLQEENIPTLLIEVEGGEVEANEKGEQLKTRVQAFLEML